MSFGFLLSILCPFTADADAAEDRTGTFEQFLCDQREPLVQFLRTRTASEADAQDAVQESLARLLRYRDSQPPQTWRPLLYRIAINVAHDQSRQDARHPRAHHVSLDDVASPLADGQQGVDELLARRQDIERIGAVVARLPRRCRQIFLLSRVEGMTNSEVARHCGISVKAVEKQMARAMAAIRRASGDWAMETL